MVTDVIPVETGKIGSSQVVIVDSQATPADIERHWDSVITSLASRGLAPTSDVPDMVIDRFEIYLLTEEEL